MDLVRRFKNRNGADGNGELPALEDDPELAVREGEGLDQQLIGQELVPVTSLDRRTLTAKGDESGKGVGVSGGRRDLGQAGQVLVEESWIKTPDRNEGRGSHVQRFPISTPVKGSELGKGAPGSAVTPYQESSRDRMIGEEENEFWSSQKHPGTPSSVWTYP